MTGVSPRTEVRLQTGLSALVPGLSLGSLRKSVPVSSASCFPVPAQQKTPSLLAGCALDSPGPAASDDIMEETYVTIFSARRGCCALQH